MADSFNRERSSLSQGELITLEEAERLERNLRIAQQHGLSYALAERVSCFKWQIRSRIQKTEEVNRLLESEARLMATYYNHQLIQKKLLNVYKHAEDQEKQRSLQDEITITKLENELNELKGLSGEGGEARVKAAVKKSQVDAEVKMARAKQHIELRRQLYRERDQAIQEIIGDGRGELTDEQRREIEDIKDIYQRLLDDL